VDRFGSLRAWTVFISSASIEVCFVKAELHLSVFECALWRAVDALKADRRGVTETVL
jgi:hypothetical protein